MSGDVTTNTGLVWARSDVPGGLVATIRCGPHPRVVRGGWATPETDHTAKILLKGLRAGVEHSVDLHLESRDGHVGESAAVHFTTANRRAGATSFVLTGDTAGQGWGINPDLGGVVGYRAMHETRPDFFLHSGDTVYADVPVIAQWDDHETHNNWYPGPDPHRRAVHPTQGRRARRSVARRIAWVLAQIKRHRIRNVVWLTADVHYCAAHHYSPERAKFTDFEPFWEFVAGPISAGGFGPNALDGTFGPKVEFQSFGTTNQAPRAGTAHYFGHVDIGSDGRMTVSLRNIRGTCCTPRPSNRSAESPLAGVNRWFLSLKPETIIVLLTGGTGVAQNEQREEQP